MQRALAAVAEARQEAEAKLIQAKAQRESAGILAEASQAMGQDPAALQLQWRLRWKGGRRAGFRGFSVMVCDFPWVFSWFLVGFGPVLPRFQVRDLADHRHAGQECHRDRARPDRPRERPTGHTQRQ